MAFDAGMLACTLHEICSVGQGGRIERVLQPERDEIVLQMRTTLGGKRLLIDAGSNNPRICFTELQKENPLIRQNIFNSLHNVCLDTFCGYKTDGVRYDFNTIFEKGDN